VLTPLEAAGIYLVGLNSKATFVTPAVTLTYRRVGTQLELTWPMGVLQSATQLNGTFTDISPAPTSPYLVTPSTGNRFYRVRIPN
jgi:hypothetical protein